MTRIVWSEHSDRDIDAIDHWLTDNASRDIAITTLTAIRERIRQLRDFPRSGRPLPETPLRLLRVFGTPYLVVYRTNGVDVAIVRICHEREDWQVGI